MLGSIQYSIQFTNTRCQQHQQFIATNIGSTKSESDELQEVGSPAKKKLKGGDQGDLGAGCPKRRSSSTSDAEREEDLRTNRMNQILEVMKKFDDGFKSYDFLGQESFEN